jgi:hypothetical protein
MIKEYQKLDRAQKETFILQRIQEKKKKERMK